MDAKPVPSLLDRLKAHGEIVVDVVNVSRLQSLNAQEKKAVVYIGRSAWPRNLGIAHEYAIRNQHTVGEDGRGIAIRRFAEDFIRSLESRDPEIIGALGRLTQRAAESGKLLLACHCSPQPCHGEVVAAALSGRLRDMGVAVKERQPFLYIEETGNSEAIKAVEMSRFVVNRYLENRRQPQSHGLGR